ncbi:MAG: Gfo/Idh/MocA family oxidoreductase [Bacteroidota bacterium]
MNRRNFIHKTAFAAGSAPFASLGSINTPIRSKQKKLGIAVLGLGFFASYVIPRIQNSSRVRVVSLISSEREKALEWATQYAIPKRNIYHYENMSEIAENEEIEGVYIVTPVGTHCEFTLQMLGAGKHVIVEKTMAANVEDGEKMVALARERRLKLMVAYRARYEPYNQQMIEFTQNQTYGRITSIAAHKGFHIGDKLGKNNWRIKKSLSGGGALVDIGIYSIQVCRYIVGEEPREVSAFYSKAPEDDRFEEVEEDITFMMKFANGILATGSASWSYSLQNYYRVSAEKGYYELQPATSNGNLRMIIKQTNPTFIGERFFRNEDQIVAEFDHFAACIQDDKEPKTNGVEGLKDLKVIEAIYRAAQEHRIVSL